MATDIRELLRIDDLTIDVETGEIIEAKPEGFVLDDPGKLDWWVGKIRALRSLAQAEKELAERVAQRATAYSRAAESLFVIFSADAEILALSLIPKGRRSAMLEHGEIGFRKVSGGVDFVDEGEALTWCREHLQEAVKIRESLLKTPIAKEYAEKGTLPPGVIYRDDADKLWVK